MRCLSSGFNNFTGKGNCEGVVKDLTTLSTRTCGRLTPPTGSDITDNCYRGPVKGHSSESSNEQVGVLSQPTDIELQTLLVHGVCLILLLVLFIYKGQQHPNPPASIF